MFIAKVYVLAKWEFNCSLTLKSGRIQVINELLMYPCRKGGVMETFMSHFIVVFIL
jgi:hypothetical protein